MSTISIPLTDRVFKRFKTTAQILSADALEDRQRCLAELRLRALELLRSWEDLASPLPEELGYHEGMEERCQRRIHFDYSQSLYTLALKHARKHLKREGIQCAEALSATIEVALATNAFDRESHDRIQHQFELLRQLAG